MGIKPRPSANKRVAVIYYPNKIARRKLTAAIETEVMPLGWEPTLWLPTSAEEPGGEQALRAMALAFSHLRIVLEPGGAAALAAALFTEGLPDTVIAVATGGNVDPALFSAIIEDRFQ